MLKGRHFSLRRVWLFPLWFSALPFLKYIPHTFTDIQRKSITRAEFRKIPNVKKKLTVSITQCSVTCKWQSNLLCRITAELTNPHNILFYALLPPRDGANSVRLLFQNGNRSIVVWFCDKFALCSKYLNPLLCNQDPDVMANYGNMGWLAYIMLVKPYVNI